LDAKINTKRSRTLDDLTARVRRELSHNCGASFSTTLPGSAAETCQEKEFHRPAFSAATRFAKFISQFAAFGARRASARWLPVRLTRNLNF
jgi:hypothetical protein